MIPGLLAEDVATALREFIATGFETDTWPFAGKFERLVFGEAGDEARGTDFIKGPYVSLGLPFLKSTTRRDLLRGFTTSYSPYAHQQQAWERLRSDGTPRSTVVATGTGSGKTECFLEPLLDHCVRHPGPGIKAIVIYPMNALAGDQAKRFARAVQDTPELRNRIRVGLFVGGAETTDQKSMGPEQVITCKQTLRKTPPDILLTNYKMLDYLLIRPKDFPLWAHNQADTLRYLVVDELHTFDGAQGADLAMLIRRLKARLGVPREHLVCVGTSATLGSDTQRNELARYAGDVFDTAFDPMAGIIGESREGHDEFLHVIEHTLLDNSVMPEQLRADTYGSFADYLRAQTALFFPDECELLATADIDSVEFRQHLGDCLKKHVMVHNVLLKAQHGPMALHEVLPVLQKQVPGGLRAAIGGVLVALLALMSHARSRRDPREPFLTVRLQLWVRELRRIVANVGDDRSGYPVALRFADDLKRDEGRLYLPVVQCSECHSTAWITRIEDGSSVIDQDLRTIYNAFFGHDRQTALLLPLPDGRQAPPGDGVVRHLCMDCGHLQAEGGVCRSCAESHLMPVFQPDLNRTVRHGGVPRLESQNRCPVCQARNTLLLFGSRAASLGSVAIHQLYANPFNDDKKLIAFSDSVQDAAHRAGFFAARTWRHNVRMAIAQALRTREGPLALEDMYRAVPGFWRDDQTNPRRLEAADYVAEFIAPNLQSDEDYLALRKMGTLDRPGRLLDLIDKRLVWEMLQEFSTQSMIGRSLERTGVACLGWDASLVDQASVRLLEVCRERLGPSLDGKRALFMLWGLLLRMKRQGAVYHPFMKSYIEDGGSWYLLSRRHLPFMPYLAGHSQVPRFPAEASEQGLDPITPRGERGWYRRWTKQLVGGDILVDDHFFDDLLPLLFEVLTDSGLLLRLGSRRGNAVWALNPAHLAVHTDVAHLYLPMLSSAGGVKDSLGDWVVPEVWLDSLDGLPSLDHFETGDVVFRRNPAPRSSFYRDFYLHGELRRVIAHEHTALLERDYRESLENRFIQGTHAWDENLLSATPTLEMGIDIGNLSSVLMCSVPPSQANYLQRAGRAGRRDGNSLVLTLANGAPHDLYFYADPKRMLAGAVEAPAIFLNASMVLRRQLLAFCFDQWGMALSGAQAIPGLMQQVLDAVERRDLGKFPYTLIDYIKRDRDVLWEGFSELLDAGVGQESRERLKAFLLGTAEQDESIDVHLLARLQELVAVRQSFTRQIKDLQSEKRSLERRPRDEALDAELREVETELDGIARLRTGLNRKETFNFFTDEGLLPNYAFPEEGTTLRSVIWRRLQAPRIDADGRATNFDSEVYEYSRPARSALSELAPESLFYANNRKVKIERIEMARGENLEHWRLCPSCSHSERIVGADQDAACPRCGDPMWANVSQLRPMVRLRQVYANTKDEDALIADDTDDREPVFFNRQMLIDFDPSDITLAYAMNTETQPFGFEFIRKASFREINFGRQGGADQVFQVAGQELPRPGFRLCKECGTVQAVRGKPEHLFKCRYKDAEGDEGIIDCLYLYREYESEAIRIRMPPLAVGDEAEQIDSFVAALQLGLKKRFGGKVDHVQITASDEPIPGSAQRDYFLVLYDSVPGGTGYLHELLTDPRNLMEMLVLSRDHMAACGCQHDPELDGCYNCLYAYRNSYGMEHTSRTTALRMLASILDPDVPLEPVARLSPLRRDAWADSELERRFPEAITAFNQHPALGGDRVRVSKDVVAGKVGFKLEIGARDYSVEIHPRLGDKDGVFYPCEPDFLIRSDRESEGFLPVAVFLDGYRYHKNVIQEDLLKRQGAFLSGRFRVWSLSWQDVNVAFAGNEVRTPKLLSEQTENSPHAVLRDIAARHGVTDVDALAALSPLPLLLRFLREPTAVFWERFAVLRVLHWLDRRTMQDAAGVAAWRSDMERWPAALREVCEQAPVRVTGSCQFGGADSNLRLSIAAEGSAIQSLDPDSIVLVAELALANVDAPGALEAWQRLLQLLNVGQFVPRFFATTTAGLAGGEYLNLRWNATSEMPLDSSAWDDLKSQVIDELRDWVVEAAKSGIPLPTVGYELNAENGAVLAEAELAWPEQRVVLLPDFQVEDNQEVFVGQGWRICTPSTELKDLKSLLEEH